MNQEEWMNETVEPVSLEIMDTMVKQYKELREEYERLKKEASDAYKPVEEVQMKIIAALKAAGKKSYKVDGVGSFAIVTKQVITAPKTIEAKNELFEYISDTYGADVLGGMLSINFQTLNSFYNEESKKSEDPSLFHMPGLDSPTVREEPRFTKAK